MVSIINTVWSRQSTVQNMHYMMTVFTGTDSSPQAMRHSWKLLQKIWHDHMTIIIHFVAFTKLWISCL